jgi:hypothetical protein
MASLIPQKIIDVGYIETMSTAAYTGDDFVNSGVEFIHVQNGHASLSYDIIITAQVTNIHHQQFGTVVKRNVAKAVGAGLDAFIGPFKQQAFNDNNEKVQITYALTSDGTTAINSNPATHLLKISTLYLDQQ